jgi:hypothetical protein
MLPSTFKEENKKNRTTLLNKLKLYKVTYDYILNPYYGKYIQDIYKETGNVVDSIGVMQLTGYTEEEVEFNFHKLMEIFYTSTKKIESYELISITH